MKPDERLEAAKRDIQSLRDQLISTRKERDEARRLCCLVISLELKTTVNDVAENMGWKCLFEAALNN